MRRDLTGLRFGRWTVLNKEDVRTSSGHTSYLCRCDCGVEKSIGSSQLTRGASKGCGCLRGSNRIGEDLVGRKFHNWTVLDEAGKTSKGNHRLFLCRCDCGVEKTVAGYSLTSGSSKSCGCANSSPDLTGRVIGRLTIIRQSGYRRNRPLWECRCECGRSKNIIVDSLASGRTRSCGCLSAETASLLASEQLKTRPRKYLYKDCGFRSRWEAYLAISFDVAGIEWQHEPEVLTVTIRGRKLRYIPDFLMPEINSFVEVKGQWLGLSKDKIQAAKASGYPISVVERKEIESLYGVGISTINRHYNSGGFEQVEMFLKNSDPSLTSKTFVNSVIERAASWQP